MKPKRIYYFDNIKALLIFLVVFGHLCESFISSSYYMYICTIIYTFHMPLFAFCSGYFSKSITARSAKRILYIYITLQIAYLFFINSLFGRYDSFSLVSPSYIMWFLISLVSWQAIQTIIKKPSFKVVTLAIIASLLAGFITSIENKFSLSRTIVFLPYYLSGHYCKIAKFDFKEFKKYKSIKITMLILSTVLLVALYSVRNSLQYSWFWGAYGYINGNTFYIRLLSYILAIVFSLTIMVFIPYNKLPLVSSIGKSTLTVFLFHGFIVLAIKKYYPFYHSAFGLKKFFLIVIMAFTITALLSLKTIKSAFNLVIRTLYKSKGISDTKSISLNNKPGT